MVVVIFTPSFAPFRRNPTDSFQTPRLTSRSINTQWRTLLNVADLRQPMGYSHLSTSRIRHSSSYKPITVPRQLSYRCAICNRKWYGFSQSTVVPRIFPQIFLEVVRIVNTIELILRLCHNRTICLALMAFKKFATLILRYLFFLRKNTLLVKCII